MQELPDSVPVPLITSLMAQPSTSSASVFAGIFSTPTDGPDLYNLEQTVSAQTSTPGAKVTQGTTRQLGCKCFGSFQGCKKARGAGD